jgi:hypothetical protein
MYNRYLLLNKDHVVAVCAYDPVTEAFQIIQQTGKLPIGLVDLTLWIENRKATKHNRYLKSLMHECGCDTREGFVNVTHAASINDTFWIKKETDTAVWNDVSLYRNEFNETISKLAFNGLGAVDLNLSSTSPELTAEGSFRKCFIRKNNDIYLYKRGSEGAVNAGREPYGEYLASKIAEVICQDSVRYDLVFLHKNIATRCKIFTNEKEGYVPMAAFPQKSPEALLNFMRSLPDNSEEKFREMLVLDAVTFNIDRHSGNFGVIIDNDTVQPLRMAPVFDLNLSMLPDMSEEELQHPGDSLVSRYEPKIGFDFTELGQMYITDSIRHKLLDLKNLDIPFHGDETFSDHRFHLLRQIIDKQIDAVLSCKKLKTTDVFIPEQKVARDQIVQKANIRLEQAYSVLEPIVDAEGLSLSVIEDDQNQEILVESEDGMVSVNIDFIDNAITATDCGRECQISMLPEIFRGIAAKAELYIRKPVQSYDHHLLTTADPDADVKQMSSHEHEHTNGVKSKDIGH